MQDFDPQGVNLDASVGGGSGCITPEPTVTEEKKLTVADIVNARRIIDGPSDKLRAVSAVKYPWCRPLWKKMIGNKWEADQVVCLRDKSEFKSLSPNQQQAFRRALAFLSNLDSIQCENLTKNITQHITDPSIQQLMGRQILEEWIHVETYSTIIESIFEDPLEIYDMYRQNPLLSDKNDFITAQGAEVSGKTTSVNKVKALVSNIALEGIYFFSGFDTIFAINRSTGKMNGSTDGVKYIQRDELTHLEIFTNTFNTLRLERPELFTKKLMKECQAILKEASEREIIWGKYVISGGIPELNDDIIEKRIQFLTEERAQAIGIGGIYPGAKNPIPWVEDYKAVTKGNFFESKPTSYTEKKPTFSRRTAAGTGVTVQK